VRVKNFKASFTPFLNKRLQINGIRAINFTQNLTPYITGEYGQDCVTPFHLFVDRTTPNQIINASTNADFMFNEDTFLPVPQAAAEGCTLVLDHVIVPVSLTFFNSTTP